MSLKLYRPTKEGLEPSPVQPEDWRDGLRSTRWHASRLANPEASALAPWQGILFFGCLAALTLGLLLVGYLTGFWS
ncbi:MAG: hypothetical protein ACXWQ6_06005 [Candidatus Limnocylindrales bacterium]